MKWESKQIKSDIERLLFKKKINFKKVEITEAGGDYDSENIIVSFKGNSLFVCGFNDSKSSDEANSEYEYVEITDGNDSRGGLNVHEGHIVPAYHSLVLYFQKKGAQVVNTIKNYF